MVKSMADELVEELGANTDEGVISLAEAFKRSKLKVEEKIDATIAFDTINYEKYSQKSRDIVVDALIKGLSDKNDEVRSTCASALSKEDLINKVSPTLRERAAKELIFTYENRNTRSFSEEYVILALGNIDYRGISKETKNKALDLLVPATHSKGDDIRDWSAIGLDKIGDWDAKKRAAEYWMPILNTTFGARSNAKFETPNFEFERLYGLDIFSRMSWPPAAEHEILKMLKEGLKDKDDYELEGMVVVIKKGGVDKHDWDAIVKAARKESVDIRASFRALGTVGSEESRVMLEGYIRENRNKQDEGIRLNVEEAQKAVRKIERRMTVPPDQAADAIKHAMEKKRVTV